MTNHPLPEESKETAQPEVVANGLHVSELDERLQLLFPQLQLGEIYCMDSLHVGGPVRFLPNFRVRFKIIPLDKYTPWSNPFPNERKAKHHAALLALAAYDKGEYGARRW